jgi:hypothetical protein
MPVLRKYVDHEGFYVVTGIRGNAITYQLTAEGAERLRQAGIRPGDNFDRFMLLDLYRTGDVFTGHSGPGEIVPSNHPGQGELDFSHDPEPEASIPLCSLCFSPDDLHLVEVESDSGPRATILCPQCRGKAERKDASVPLALVSRKLLIRFLAIEEIENKDASVLAFQRLLDRDFSMQWEVLKKAKPVQEQLLPETGGLEGKLL